MKDEFLWLEALKMLSVCDKVKKGNNKILWNRKKCEIFFFLKIYI